MPASNHDVLNQQVVRASEMAVMQLNEMLKRIPNAIGVTSDETSQLSKDDIKRLGRKD